MMGVKRVWARVGPLWRRVAAWSAKRQVHHHKDNVAFLEEARAAYDAPPGPRSWYRRGWFRFAAVMRLRPGISVERALLEELEALEGAEERLRELRRGPSA